MPADASGAALPHELHHAVERLLAQAGRTGTFRATRLGGGTNNAVFRLETSAAPFCLKAYSRDTRNRLATEFAFLTFAWERELRAVPQPVARDEAHHIGLFEFIEGNRIAPETLTEESIGHAVAFHRGLNRWRGDAAAGALPPASDSCFSIDEHIASLQRRIDALAEWPVDDAAHRPAAAFLHDDLLPAGRTAIANLKAWAAERGFETARPLAREEQCLSASDFGFHNALQDADGRIRFIDFEYAGWDDPAKMTADFFGAPSCPVDERFFDTFVSGAFEGDPHADAHIDRARALLPFHRVKWAMILMKHFAPDATHPVETGAEKEARLATHLDRARAQLARATRLF